MESEITNEMLEEASKWIIVHTVSKTYLVRNTDIIDDTSETKHIYELNTNNFVIENGKLVGFKLYGCEDVIRIPDGRVEYSDSYSSHDWMYEVYEDETYELRLKQNLKD